MKKAISFKLDSECIELLKQLAEKQKRSQANTLEWIITQAYENNKKSIA